MPSHDLFVCFYVITFTMALLADLLVQLYFQSDLTLIRSWYLPGTHYSRTLEDWLRLQDRNKKSRRIIFEYLSLPNLPCQSSQKASPNQKGTPSRRAMMQQRDGRLSIGACHALNKDCISLRPSQVSCILYGLLRAVCCGQRRPVSQKIHTLRHCNCRCLTASSPQMGCRPLSIQSQIAYRLPSDQLG